MVRVDTADAFDWLPANAGTGAVVAVLPDAAEVNMAVDAWTEWFRVAAAACFAASTGPTVFLQTDRKVGGRWIDKAALIADVANVPLLWHRIVLRRGVGATDIHRPTYSHLVAYGPGRPGRPAPDVIDGGKRLWRDGIGVAAARFIADYLHAAGVPHVLNPFAGHGTILAAAAAAGMDATGCELDPERAAIAARVGDTPPLIMGVGA